MRFWCCLQRFLARRTSSSGEIMGTVALAVFRGLYPIPIPLTL